MKAVEIVYIVIGVALLAGLFAVLNWILDREK